MVTDVAGERRRPRQRPVARPCPELTRLIERTSDACAAHRDRRSQALGVADALAEALTTTGWLPESLQTTNPERYRPHLAYVAPDGAFSILAMAWLPGQRTPIHDHVAWCVVGVYRGTEINTSYSLHDDDGRTFLARGPVDTMLPGAVAALVPPDEDIHSVQCGPHGASVSLHIYGTDVSRRGTSINRRFDHLPIESEPAGERISWRAAFA